MPMLLHAIVSYKSFAFSLIYCHQINLLLEYIIWNSSNSFHISKHTTTRECYSLKLVPDIWKKIHVSLLPKKIGKVPATCLNLFQFQLPELLRQKQALCLIYPCDCLSLAWGTFPWSTIIRKENLHPFLWYLPPNKSTGNVFTEREVYWSKGGGEFASIYLIDLLLLFINHKPHDSVWPLCVLSIAHHLT